MLELRFLPVETAKNRVLLLSGMTNEICPQCGKKQFNSSSGRCYACGAERRPDGSFVRAPAGYFADPYGNLRTAERTELKDRKLCVSFHYLLEPGKTTLRGEHSKLADEPKCVHPERLSCDYGTGFDRCEFMKNTGGLGRWTCSASPK